MKVIFKRFLVFPLIGILTCSFGNAPPKKFEEETLPLGLLKLQCPPHDKEVFCHPNNAIHFLQIFKRDQNGEKLMFNTRIGHIDTTSYECFMQSIAIENAGKGIEWCPGRFSLMYSFPVSGGYGKREYIRLTRENFASFRVAIIQKEAHLDWVPHHWFPANASCQ